MASFFYLTTYSWGGGGVRQSQTCHPRRTSSISTFQGVLSFMWITHSASNRYQTARIKYVTTTLLSGGGWRNVRPLLGVRLQGSDTDTID